VGIAWSWAAIDSVPGRAEGAAAFTSPAPGGEARASNPDGGRGTHSEVVTPLGPAGPRAAAETPDRMTAASDVRIGSERPGAQAHLGRASTATRFDGHDRLTAEATASLDAVRAGGLRAAAVESSVRVEFGLDQEPLVGYRLTLVGIEAADRPVAAVDGAGLTIAEERVPAGRLVDDFNRQVATYGALLGPLAGSVTLLAPHVERGAGDVTVTGAVVELHGTAAAPVPTAGTGLRLAAVEVRARLARRDAAGPGVTSQRHDTPAAPAGSAPVGTGPSAPGRPVTDADRLGTTGPGTGLVGPRPPTGPGRPPPATDERRARRPRWRWTAGPGRSPSTALPVGSFQHDGFIEAASVLMALCTLRGVAVARRGRQRRSRA
jgi:hypothetical protein